MAQFKEIVEAVLRNSFDCELARVELTQDEYGYYTVKFDNLTDGDSIKIEVRETEVI